MISSDPLIISARLTHYVLPTREAPSFAIPIFTLPQQTDALLVQLANPSSRIFGFESFDPQGATLTSLLAPRECIIGNEMLFVFIAIDGRELVGSQRELSFELRQRLDELKQYPLLALNVADFCAMTSEISSLRRAAFESLERLYSPMTAALWRDQTILLPILRTRLESLLHLNIPSISQHLENILIEGPRIILPSRLHKILASHDRVIEQICTMMSDEAQAFHNIEYMIEPIGTSTDVWFADYRTLDVDEPDEPVETVRYDPSALPSHLDRFEMLSDQLIDFSNHLVEVAELGCRYDAEALNYAHTSFLHRQILWKEKYLSDGEGTQLSLLKTLSLLLHELSSVEWVEHVFERRSYFVTPEMLKDDRFAAREELRKNIIAGRGTYLAFQFVINILNWQETQRVDRSTPFQFRLSRDLEHDVMVYLTSPKRDDMATFLVLKALYADRQ